MIRPRPPGIVKYENLQAHTTVKNVLAENHPISHSPNGPRKVEAGQAPRHIDLSRKISMKPYIKEESEAL